MSIKSPKIDVRGEWGCGDSLKIQLTSEMLPADDIVCQIETKIKSLRSLYFEFVIVDLQKRNAADMEYPLYFQVLRNREFGQTDTYLVELGMMVDRGTIHYIKDAAYLTEVLESFRVICVERKKPKADEWRIGNCIYDADDDGNKENQCEQCKRFLSQYWQKQIDGAGIEFAEYEAWEYVVEHDSDPYFSCEIAREYERRGLYNKLKTSFQTHSSNPVIAQINGEMALHGVFGKPDYKTAYLYFSHAMTIGSLLAEYYIAKMYQYGLYVEKSYETYEQMIRSVYAKYSDGIIECCPRRVFLEMSKIEQRVGNSDAAIEYCITPLKTQRLLMRTGYGNITESDSKVVNQLYKLIEFDSDDIDLLDLLYVLTRPCKVHIFIGRKRFAVQAINRNGRIMVKCGKNYYRNAVDFLQHHKIKDRYLATYIDDIDFMEIA